MTIPLSLLTVLDLFGMHHRSSTLQWKEFFASQDPGWRHRSAIVAGNAMAGAVIGKSDMWSAGVVIYVLLASWINLQSAVFVWSFFPKV